MIGADPEYRSLLAASVRIGRDPALVQGPGGNVSLKRDGMLWVKASGTWLAAAQQREIMVPVRLDPMLRALDEGDAAENAGAFVVAELNPSGLRPSVETTLHAVLPHPVVIHVHCVETMAWAALEGAEAALATLLDGLRWCFVPYIRPGPPLTRAMRGMAPPGTDVFVLGNHGLVVGGADAGEAEALMREVARRLRRPVRAAPPPDLPRLAALASGSRYRPAPDPAMHGTGADPASLAVARRGSLYPDHVVFLGPGIVALPAGDTAAEIGQDGPPLLVIPGAGVLLRADASPGAAALARCLADVTARLDPSETIHPLTSAQEAELLGWDAEKYRQGLDRR